MKDLIKAYQEFIHTIKKESQPHDYSGFYSLFDGGKNFDGALAHARTVFNHQFLPFAKKYLGDITDKISLDIGFGSGLQVLEASKHFFARGVDIHREGRFIKEDLARRGFDTHRVALFDRTPADSLPNMLNPKKMENLGPEVEIDRSSDLYFVHSWVTFLHFPSIEYTTKVLAEIYKALIPNGIAVIYYSRLVKTKKMETKLEYEADLKREELHKTGFEAAELLTQIFKKGIGIAQWKMTEIVRQLGFEILEHTNSNDGGFIFGQHGIVIRKPPVVGPKETVEELDPVSDVKSPTKIKKVIRRRPIKKY